MARATSPELKIAMARASTRHDGAHQNGLAQRMPRITIATDIRLRLRNGERVVHAENISRGGMKVMLDEVDCVGEQVMVVLSDDVAPMTGTIRWQEEGRAGIAFDEVLDIDRLAAWLTTLS